MVLRWRGIGFAPLVFAGLILAGCDSSPEPPTTVSATDTALPTDLKTQVRDQLTANCDSADALEGAVKGLLNQPGPDTLDAAKAAWKSAHQTYQTVALLYQLADTAPPHWYQDQRDPVDAHPMLPGYLDQVPGYPNSGLVYSETPLSPSFLKKNHQSTDFFYLTLGFHPMEFLLWERPGGKHPSRIYDSEGAEDSQGIRTQLRRRTLLRLISERLTDDLRALCTPPNEAYLIRQLHQRLSGDSSVTAIVEEALETTLGEALQRRQKHPSGQTGDGMPVAHSPWAGTDIAEWRHLLSSFRENGLPALTENDVPDSLLASLKSLEETMSKLPKSPSGESLDPVLEALAQLNAQSDD